jgi:hypothetical protein
MTATLLSADEYIATGDTRSRWTQLVNREVIVNNPTIRHPNPQLDVDLVHHFLMGKSWSGRFTCPARRAV